MEVWRITWFTVVCAAAATALILPPGVVLAWLLARRKFPGRVLVETFVSLPLVMPPVADRPDPADAPEPPRQLGRRARAAGDRGRLHVEGGRAGDGDHGAAAPGADRARRVRAGQRALRAGRGDARRLTGAHLPDDQPAARWPSVLAAPCSRSRARSESSARRSWWPAAFRARRGRCGGDLRLRGDGAGRHGARSCCSCRWRSRSWRLDREPARRAERRRDRSRHRGRAGLVCSRREGPARRARGRALRSVRRRQDDHPRRDRRPAHAAARLDRRQRARALLVGRRVNLPPHHRHVGYVPQDVALFPHMLVRGNLLYGRHPGEAPRSRTSGGQAGSRSRRRHAGNRRAARPARHRSLGRRAPARRARRAR